MKKTDELIPQQWTGLLLTLALVVAAVVLATPVTAQEGPLFPSEHTCKIHPSAVEPGFNHVICDDSQAPCREWVSQPICPWANSLSKNCVKEHGTRECTSAEKQGWNFPDTCFVAWQKCGDGAVEACASGTSTGQSGTNTFVDAASDWAGASCTQFQQGQGTVTLTKRCRDR